MPVTGSWPMKTKFRGKDFTLSITQSATINGVLEAPELYTPAHHEAHFEQGLLYSLSWSLVLSSNLHSCFPLKTMLVFFFWDRILLGWSQTHSNPASTSQILGLETWVKQAWCLYYFFYSMISFFYYIRPQISLIISWYSLISVLLLALFKVFSSL